MDTFQLIKPSPVLSPYVRHYWILETSDVADKPERIIPFGNIQLTFYSGEPVLKANEVCRSKALLCGQSIGYTDILPTGRLRIIAVVFHVIGARAFFRLPMDELAGLKISAGDFADRELEQLEEQVASTSDYRECICKIEQFLSSRLRPYQDYNYHRLLRAVQLINHRKGEVRIDELAGETCLSDKQFRRVFSSHVGINPKDFIRTVRFQYALYLLQNNPQLSFSQLAYDSGYYDQAHLINEFKTFSGYTPGEFIAICEPYSDYFS